MSDQDEKTPRWARAWKCTGCGHCWWGEWRGGKPRGLEFCEDCGGPVVLGAAQVEGTSMMKNAPFKPANPTAGVSGQGFVCTHCGAPNVGVPSG